MRKIFLLAMTLALAVSLVACGNSGTDEKDNNDLLGDLTGPENPEASKSVQSWFWADGGYVFKYAHDLSLEFYEPGAISIAYVKVINKTDNAVDLSAVITVSNSTKSIYEVLEYFVIPDGFEGNVERSALVAGVTLKNGEQQILEAPIRLEAGESKTFAVAVKMMESAGNQYQQADAKLTLEIKNSALSEDGDDNTQSPDGTTPDGGTNDDDKKPGGEVNFPSVDF